MDELVRYCIYIQNKYDVLFKLSAKREVSSIINKPCIILGALRVNKELRSCGIGTQVMEEFTEWADENNYTVILEPAYKNLESLLRFYSKFGFEFLSEEEKGKLLKGNISSMPERMIRFPRIKEN